jgi:hypothetical protein
MKDAAESLPTDLAAAHAMILAEPRARAAHFCSRILGNPRGQQLRKSEVALSKPLSVSANTCQTLRANHCYVKRPNCR